MASSGLSASTAAPPILPSSSDPLPAASTSISKLALPTQPLPLPQDAKVPSPLLAYHQNLAAHLVTLIQANTTRSPNKLSSRSFPEKQLCKSSLPPSLPPSKHARHAALPPPTLPENPRQKSDSSLESTAITTEVGTDSAGSGLASKVSSLSTAPTSLRSASAGIIGDSKQKEAQRTSPTGRIAVAGPAASGPVAPQLEQAHQRTQCSARISHPSGYVHPTSISRSNSLTDSLTLDLTARPDHLARFSPLLLPECGADANADVSASAVAGPSRSARPSQPTLDRHSTSGVQDLPRASHTSHREYANEYESASEEEHGDTHHHAQARSIASDAETREEEHRKAWETEGRHVWKVIPNGFELKLQQGSKQSKRASGEYKSTDKEECQRAPSGPSSVRGRTQLGDSVTKRSQRLSMGQPSPPDEGYLGVGRGGDHVATSISACSNTRDRDQDVSRPGSTSISEFDSQGGPSRPQSRAQQLREPYQVPYHTGLGIILPDQIQSSLSALDPGPTNQARDRDVKSSSQQKLRVVNPDQDECEGPTRKQANGDEGVGRQHRDRDRNHSGSEAGDVERSGGNDDHEDLASKEYKAKRDEKLKKKGAVLRLRVVKWWQEVMDATPDMGSIVSVFCDLLELFLWILQFNSYNTAYVEAQRSSSDDSMAREAALTPGTTTTHRAIPPLPITRQIPTSFPSTRLDLRPLSRSAYFSGY